MAFISSPSTNSGKGEVSTVSVQAPSGQVTTANSEVTAASFSHDTIDEDDIEEIDIKWNMDLLSMRADRFWKWNERNAPKSQERGKRENYKKNPKVEEPGNKAMMAFDGSGWDWSYMAEEEENHALVADEEEVPTEFALMAKSSSSSDNELNEELFDSESDLCNYKRGLSQVEARLVEFKVNETKFCEKVRLLEYELEVRNNKIESLTNELEEVKKEKESVDHKLTGFENALKNLDDLLGNQRSVKDKTGLPEFVDNTVTDYSRPTPSIDVSKGNSSEPKGNTSSVFEQGETSGNFVSKPWIKFVKGTSCPSVIKVNNNENARRPTVKYAEMYRKTSQSSRNSDAPIIEDWESETKSEVDYTIRPSIKQASKSPRVRENQRN
ncbi:hypothetical protein Tco_0432673 [Tanacetum coccineum]